MMPPINLQLKHYQQNTLDDFKSYLKSCVQQGAKHAFITAANVPYRSAPNISEDTPYVCMRIPTGGGKTIMAAHAVGIAAQEYLKASNPMVLWLVPSDAIRDQTITALRDINHPYRAALARDFGDNISILSKDEALNLSHGDALGRACIIVSTIQSFRRTTKNGNLNPDGLRVYKDSGALMAHFSGLNESQRERLTLVKGTCRPVASLSNLLKLHRPMVIVDEAHNARKDLSFETLERFAPSLILELTATPILQGSHASNILSSVSAAELKVEEMIKMPIKLKTDTDWQQTIGAALDCQHELEEAAKIEQKDKGEYIRPIILFQAQPAKGTEPITHEIIREFLIKDKRIPPQQIAVHTGKYKDLDDLDIEDPQCPVRYVITVQRLKEGWDCPFAYILCSVAAQSSSTAIEQILGRVLRMPKAKRKQNKALNKAYAFVASSKFDEVARQLRDGLVDGAGFESIEADQLIQSQDTLGFDTGDGDVEDDAPALMGSKGQFQVPMLAFNCQGEMQLFTEDHFLNLPWPLEKCDPTKIDQYLIIRGDAQTGELDVSDDGRVTISFSGVSQQELAGVIYEPSWTQKRLVSWLCRNLQSRDVTLPSAIEFNNNVVGHLISSGHKLADIARSKYRLRDALRAYIYALRQERQNGNYDALFDAHADKFAISSDHAVIFDEQRYSYNQPYAGSTIFNKHFTSIVGDLKHSGEEFECAVHLDRMSEVQYWIRNVERQIHSFWLQLPTNKFYPDFIAKLQDGRILVVEYKGGHLYEEAETKRRIGDFWAEVSDGQCLFCMPTDRGFDLIDRTVRDSD
jgi:superfamily II DNA or RNA helicase